MEEKDNVSVSKPVFKNQPISCPWVSCQPYQSAQSLKNNLSDMVKKHGATALNNTSSKKPGPAENPTLSAYAMPAQQSSSTHFFYFLRLMQLFPDTHPATLHTVLTLSKSNFFFTIDKLLYAQKCKSELKRKLTSMSGRGRGYIARQSYSRPNQSQRYQSLSRTVSTDLAEVQRIIDLAEKPYLGVHTVDNASVAAGEVQPLTDEMVNICVENSEQLVQGTETYVETDNHEVIEIVCYDNDQTVLKQDKNGDAMQTDTFHENFENIEPSINENISISKMDEESEPPVIVVGTMHDCGGADCLADDHLEPSSHALNQEDSINLANISN